MRVLATIHSPEAIRRILECLGLPSLVPPIAPAELEAEAQSLDPDLGPVDSIAE
jgi:hypothetical protein